MRIVRFFYSGVESYGTLVDDDKVLNLLELSAIKKRPLPLSLDELVSLGIEGLNLLENLIDDSTGDDVKEALVERNEVKMEAPISSPPKIICLGLNYRDHAEEGGAKIPDEPIIFMKPRTSIIGPEELIIKPKFVKQLDYEVELAIIIGKRGKNIPSSEAEDYIFGYTAFNDVSARDIQFKDGQWTRGKSFDTFAPIGPCITTTSQIGDPNNLHLLTRVNGEVRQNSSTRNMIFNVYEIVHQMSRVMTLEPCDIIATGTPAGVAAFMKPKPVFLSPGDIVEIEVENIGTLRNSVTEE